MSKLTPKQLVEKLRDLGNHASYDPHHYHLAAGMIEDMFQSIHDALDDMGNDGKCICGLNKANFRYILGKDVDDLEYSFEDALKVKIECDEMHGKRSHLRDLHSMQSDENLKNTMKTKFTWSD